MCAGEQTRLFLCYPCEPCEHLRETGFEVAHVACHNNSYVIKNKTNQLLGL